MIRKDVYTQLNGLDEEFGLGYYEDTDFNYRATKSGLQLIITEDSFVYHRGSGSFSKASSEVRRMVKRNKQLFRRKHGHGILAKHWRTKNIAALKRYLDAPSGKHSIEQLRYKFRNRFLLAQQLIPNSPLKKFLYYRRLKQIAKQFTDKYNHY